MEVMPKSVDTIEIRIPRPPNAFMIFGQKFRRVLAQKFQNLSNKQISKILGDEWKKMDVETKTHYHSLAEEAHRQHLIKYPGYYYSPLEARQRKAERKRKSKMSKTSHKPKTVSTNCSDVQTFGGNRPFPFQPPMHPMLRPIFGTPIVPRIRFAQPMVRYGPNPQFGGFITFGFTPQPRHPFVVPIKSEHNYASQLRADPPVQQMIGTGLETQTSSDVTDVTNQDMDLLSSYMMPMHNPMVDVTAVVDSQANDETNSALEPIMAFMDAMQASSDGHN